MFISCERFDDCNPIDGIMKETSYEDIILKVAELKEILAMMEHPRLVTKCEEIIEDLERLNR
jgi:hypothetical protein